MARLRGRDRHPGQCATPTCLSSVTGHRTARVEAALAKTAPCRALRITATALGLGLSLGLAQAQVPGFEDSMAQRVLACTGCHGKDGRAASDGYYPRIAGKPSAYLLRQLRAFRDGKRQYALMATLLAPLNDDYLQEIADHFARLDLPYAAPQGAKVDAATLHHGRVLALQGDAARGIPACQACHGTALTGAGADVPGLLGLPVDYLNAQLGAWQTGVRHAQAPDCMAQIAQRLAPGDVNALSHWLAAQPVPAAARAAPMPPRPAPLRCGSMPGTAAAGAAR
jgi:cytochrome c553